VQLLARLQRALIRFAERINARQDVAEIVRQSHRQQVLVAEDHSDTAECLRLLLTMNGHQVRVANCVAQALNIAEEYEFDVLISDIGLPDGRGTELLTRLRETRQQDISAIAMTGFGMDRDLEESRLAGFTAHLTKPVEYSALEQVLVRLSATSPTP